MIYGDELGAGGISTKTIPPQGLNLTLKGGNGKIDCTFTGIASQWLYLGQYYRLIAKPGSAPTSPMDGVQVKDVQVGAIGDAVISASITGLTNGVQYYVRLYVRGDNGWQTSVDAVGTATPLASVDAQTLALGSLIRLDNADGSYANWMAIDLNNRHPGMLTLILNNPTISCQYGSGVSYGSTSNIVKANCESIYAALSDRAKSVVLLSTFEYRYTNNSNYLTVSAYAFPPGHSDYHGKYQYFSGDDYITKRIAYNPSGQAVGYWERDAASTSYVWAIGDDGYGRSAGYSETRYVRPIINILPDTQVMAVTNADGSHSLVA